MSQCIKCDRPGTIPVAGNIYIVSCPRCGNLQSKDAHTVKL